MVWYLGAERAPFSLWDWSLGWLRRVRGWNHRLSRRRLKGMTLGSAVTLCVALAASAPGPPMGGGGPLEVLRWKGDVQITALSTSSFFRASLDSPKVGLTKGWQRVRRGTYVGSFAIRTGRSSWLQFNGACLDASSHLRIDAMTADLFLELKRGGVSKRDGKPGPSLIKPGRSAYW